MEGSEPEIELDGFGFFSPELDGMERTFLMSGQDQERDKNGFIEWVSDASVRADGFWNPNGDESARKGSHLTGILLMLRLTDADGKKLKNPFYIFELTEDLLVDAQVDQKPVPFLKAGQRVGVAAWKMLSGITRRMGHEFRVDYLGKKRLANGNLFVNLKVSYSRSMVREIERQSPSLFNEGDKEEGESGR